MAVGTWNFKIVRGTTFRRTLQLVDEAGTPIDLTGALPKMRITPSGAAEFDLTIGNSKLTLLDQTSLSTRGMFTMHLSDEETETYSWSRANYWLNIDYANGDEIAYLEGVITVRPLGRANS